MHEISTPVPSLQLPSSAYLTYPSNKRIVNTCLTVKDAEQGATTGRRHLTSLGGCRICQLRKHISHPGKCATQIAPSAHLCPVACAHGLEACAKPDEHTAELPLREIDPQTGTLVRGHVWQKPFLNAREELIRARAIDRA